MKKILLIVVLLIGGFLVVFPFNTKEKKEILEEKPEEKVPSKAEVLLDSMSLEEKVGQMFIVRHPASGAVDDINTYKLGGYIMFARDFQNETPDSIVEKINTYQTTSSIPMLMGVDEEGGTVVRISKYKQFRSEAFKSPQEVYQNGGFENVRNDTRDKAEFLKNLGINVNFAPVSDVSLDPKNYIYKRTFGASGEKTAEYIREVVSVMASEKIGSMLKHFPGYGSNLDTHTGIAIDNRSYEEFVNNDFLPFKAGIEEGANMVLVSHNIVKSMDPDYPSSLSLRVHEILRNELKFNGVIITDDLVMGAIKKYARDDGEVAILAVEAGNDLLCSTDYKVQIPAVIDAVNSGRISIERINESVLRILDMKEELGII